MYLLGFLVEVGNLAACVLRDVMKEEICDATKLISPPLLGQPVPAIKCCLLSLHPYLLQHKSFGPVSPLLLSSTTTSIYTSHPCHSSNHIDVQVHSVRTLTVSYLSRIEHDSLKFSLFLSSVGDYYRGCQVCYKSLRIALLS